MITFARCFIGVGFIYMSIKVCEHWGRAYHLHHLLVMESYLDRSHNFWERGSMSWLPISWKNGAMEFRIMHHILCEHFMIQRSACAFDEYVHRIFEKFLLRIIGMHEIDWFLICCVALLNWLRLQYGLDVHDCLREPKAELYCVETGDPECLCHKVAAMQNFVIIGFTVLAFTIVLAVTSRVYELRIMSRSGVHTSDDYALYLDSAEKEAQRQVVTDRKRFNADTLKDAVMRMKELAEEAKAKEDNWWLSLLIDGSHDCYLTMTCPGCLLRRPQGSWHRCGRFLEKPQKKAVTRSGKPMIIQDFDEEEEEGETGSWGGSSATASVRAGAPGNGNNPTPSPTSNKSAANASAGGPQTVLVANQGRSFANQSLGASRKTEESASLSQHTSLDSIFLFGSPFLYFQAVAITMMPISLYLSLWVTNFAAAATELGGSDNNRVYWQLLSLCPGFFAPFIYAYSVRVASLLQAVTQIDHDAVEVSTWCGASVRVFEPSFHGQILTPLLLSLLSLLSLSPHSISHLAGNPGADRVCKAPADGDAREDAGQARGDRQPTRRASGPLPLDRRQRLGPAEPQ